MKIAQVNKYLYPKGGADIYCLRLGELLRKKGHGVVLLGMEPPDGEEPDLPAYTVSAVDYESSPGGGDKLSMAAGLVYSREAARQMARLIRHEQPDLVHFHNIYHQLSPSVILTAWSMGVPTVMTLHDYKITCTVYSHYRRGVVCEDCRRGRFYNTVWHRCVKESWVKSLLGAAEMYLHRGLLRSYEKVDVRISPSRFLRDKMHELGFSAPIRWLPYFVDVEGFRPRYDWDRPQICYFGRLSSEKGVPTLLDAVSGLDLTLRIIGRGPEEEALKRKVEAEGIEHVTFEGFQYGENLREMIRSCMFPVVSSEWYDNNPLAIYESFALGKPVVGARLGGIPELIGRDRGRCFTPGAAAELRDVIADLVQKPEQVRSMGRNARRYAEKQFAPDVHYERLMDVYRNCAAEAEVRIS